MSYDTAEAIRQRISGLRWSHPIGLGHGVITREGAVHRRFQRRLRLVQIPQDLRGWTVLDIGSWDGFFAFECEKRGADRVLAIDTYAWDTYGVDCFLAAREILSSKVEYKRIDVHEVTPEGIGTFDLVLFLGVFYHLRNPLSALERIKSITRRLMICETHLLLPFIHEKYPLIPFFQGDENCSPDVPELCAKPTLECLKRMLKAAGFSQLEVKYTPSFRYWKKFLSLVTNYPQSGRGIVHARP